MFVKPGPNREIPGTLLRVRIPRTHALLPETGAEVPANSFWLQRIAHGDVVAVNPATTKGA
jgi:hypothetical protein